MLFVSLLALMLHGE